MLPAFERYALPRSQPGGWSLRQGQSGPARGGCERCPPADTRPARWWHWDLPGAQGYDPFGEGGPGDITAYVDGALLIDLWDELVLPPSIRAAWNGVVTGAIEERVA